MSIYKKNLNIGLERGSSKALSRIDPNSQMGRVLEALRIGPKSNIELMAELNIAHPPAVVRSLRGQGFRIETEEHSNPSRPEGKIKRYRLIAKG